LHVVVSNIEFKSPKTSLLVLLYRF